MEVKVKVREKIEPSWFGILWRGSCCGKRGIDEPHVEIFIIPERNNTKSEEVAYPR